MKTLFLSLSLIVSLQLFAGEALKTNRMLDVYNKAMDKAAEYGAKNVLVVLDIDNTILTTNQQLGSDQWFTWQEKGLAQETCEYCVTSDFGELLNIQGKLFALSAMKPTEVDVPLLVKQLQKRGVSVILLTSRGPELRSVTERELKNNNYDLTITAIGKNNGFAGTYAPYDLEKPRKAGLSETDIQTFGLKKPRAVSYQNGVYMTAGQHKGIMLRNLLKKTKSKFKAIVFADDHEKHTIRMQAAFEDKKEDVTTYRYGGVDYIVQNFDEVEKTKVQIEWQVLKTTFKAIFK